MPLSPGRAAPRRVPEGGIFFAARKARVAVHRECASLPRAVRSFPLTDTRGEARQRGKKGVLLARRESKHLNDIPAARKLDVCRPAAGRQFTS